MIFEYRLTWSQRQWLLETGLPITSITFAADDPDSAVLWQPDCLPGASDSLAEAHNVQLTAGGRALGHRVS